MKKVLLSAAIAAALLGATAPQALAEETICEGTISKQVIRGDVFVPIDASCTLDRVVVRGEVWGGVDARLVRLQRTVVEGAVTCDGCRRIEIDRSLIGGQADIREARNGVEVCWSNVTGTTGIAATTGIRLGASPTANGCGSNFFGAAVTIAGGAGTASVLFNVVDGPLTVSGREGASDISRNVVTGALDCAGNDPAPTGSGNLAGQKLGQCAAL